MKRTSKTSSLKTGDAVSWVTSQGITPGKVMSKVTKSTKVDAYTAKASLQDPQFKVKSTKTGKVALHKPGALRRGTA